MQILFIDSEIEGHNPQEKNSFTKIGGHQISFLFYGLPSVAVTLSLSLSLSLSLLRMPKL
jgi:hypothetical protein